MSSTTPAVRCIVSACCQCDVLLAFRAHNCLQAHPTCSRVHVCCTCSHATRARLLLTLHTTQAKEAAAASQEPAPQLPIALDETGALLPQPLLMGLHRVPENIDVLVCELCSGGHNEERIILCDKCDKGFHMFCLSPALEDVPDGEWVCPLCLKAENGELTYG